MTTFDAQTRERLEKEAAGMEKYSFDDEDRQFVADIRAALAEIDRLGAAVMRLSLLVEDVPRLTRELSALRARIAAAPTARAFIMGDGTLIDVDSGLDGPPPESYVLVRILREDEPI